VFALALSSKLDRENNTKHSTTTILSPRTEN
jgi:hypothetical protein